MSKSTKVSKILLCWVGRADLDAPSNTQNKNTGPIAQAIKKTPYSKVILFSNYDENKTSTYLKWLIDNTGQVIIINQVDLISPTHYISIYESVTSVLQEYKGDDGIELTFHLSPGTSAMAAIWIILANTSYPANLIESSIEFGVKEVQIPFELSAELIPEYFRESDITLNRHSSEIAPESSKFGDIIYRSTEMNFIIKRAKKVALRSLPILIEGESGTGKELMARAIHQHSPRQKKPMVVVNCGAISPELIESELFGHEKGAFTGATKDRKGYFESADGSTLFLDEIGELPLNAQVKLLRVIQENEIMRVGSSKIIKIDVRIIAATNRILLEEVSNNKFREDLFYRLAVAILSLPPLRNRSGDIELLIDHSMKQINNESKSEPNYIDKKISENTKNLMASYHWPGNVRELLNTLRRASVWSSGAILEKEDIESAIFKPVENKLNKWDKPINNGIDLELLVSKYREHYINKALTATHNNKTKAAKLLGLSSYQTLNNLIEKHCID
jgi:transcriptional regulator with GAF, ATPase, and Fis domain